MKQIALLLTLESCSAFFKPGILEGSCPHGPGKITTDLSLSGDFDPHKLVGPWINLIDEKDENLDKTCMGSKIVHSHEAQDDDHPLFEFFQSNSITNTMRNKLRQSDDPAAHDQYYVSMGMQLHFRNRLDKTIGYLEYSELDLDYDHPENYDENQEAEQISFDPYVFDSQYLRYVQVLDTDYDNYFVMYACQEIARIVDKESGEEITPHEAWVRSTRIAHHDIDAEHTILRYDYPEDQIERIFYHKQKIQVMWKPVYKKVIGHQTEKRHIQSDIPTFPEEEIPQSKIDELFKKIGKILPKDFPYDKLKEKYGKQVHKIEMPKKSKDNVHLHEDCDYDPYETDGLVLNNDGVLDDAYGFEDIDIDMIEGFED